MNPFTKATRQAAHLKLAISGPAGSVKTYSANLLASGLADGGRIALLDTENHSASLYADRFDFDVIDISPPFTGSKFIDAIHAAEREKYPVAIADSLTHAWEGTLDYKSQLDAKGGNSYVNWNQAGSKFKEVMAAILQSRIHVIACMRSKMDYILEQDSRGKMVPRRVGMAPVMRDGIEYEFTTVFDGDLEHYVTVSKDRTGLFTDQRFQITRDTGTKLLDWLKSAPVADGSTIQHRLAQALTILHPDWITDFLINRKQIAPDQSIADVSEKYCESALARIDDFRNAIADFGRSRDQIPLTKSENER